MITSLADATFTERLRRLLETGEGEATRRGIPLLVSTSVAMAPVDTIVLFERAAVEERVLWEQPSEGLSMVAVGVAERLTGGGDERFSQVADGWRQLKSRTLMDTRAPLPFPGPVCLGGFAFDPACQPKPQWLGYGDAELVVPKFLITASGGASWLTVNVAVPPGCNVAGATDAVIGALDQLLSGQGPEKRGERLPGRLVVEDDAQANRWKEAVDSVVGEIRQGVVEKLVLAREVRARCVQGLDPGAVMRRLRSGYGDCTIFAFARGDSCFLGATPERLVRLDGQVVRAMCLAGSGGRGTSADEDRRLGEALLADGKERHEHALVVRALRDALGPLCSRLHVAETPVLLRTPDLQHLYTPVEGVLKGRGDILGLVRRLHPTPAAGGLPREAALSLIRSYEPFQRGWYAGPVGWMDGSGGGEFVVAIRSALLKGDEAWLYAGCGLVAESDAEREYQESCLKLRSMLWALNGKLA
ncbi:MAG: isochorismate synthase MenF [Dehalococcoidia bacterium]